MEEMHENIATRLRDFWDAGIRGPDFVWAATGPALEAYSKHPVVRKSNEPGQLMTVSEFLRHVRRIVVDFVVGRVLSGNDDAEAVSGLDDVTTFYESRIIMVVEVRRAGDLMDVVLEEAKLEDAHEQVVGYGPNFEVLLAKDPGENGTPNADGQTSHEVSVYVACGRRTGAACTCHARGSWRRTLRV